MKRIMTIVGIIFIYQSTFAKSKCFDSWSLLLKRPVKSSYGEFEFKEKITKTENLIKFFRKRKENQESAVTLRVKKVIENLDNNLITDQFDVVHKDLRTFMRDYEFAYITHQRNAPVLEKLEKSTRSKLSNDSSIRRFLNKDGDDYLKDYYEEIIIEFNRTKKEGEGFKDWFPNFQDQRLFRLTNDYEKYKGITNYLTKLKDGKGESTCNEACQKNIETLLNVTGLKSEKERHIFKNLIGNSERFAKEDLSRVVNSTQRSTLIRLRLELIAEIQGFFSSLALQPEFLNKVFTWFYKVPFLERTRVVQLLKAVYDLQAKKLHFPKINRVTRYAGDEKDLFAFMKQQNVGTNDEFLIAFARRQDIESRKTWDQLFAYAANLRSRSKDDKKYHQRMVKAADRARWRGEISANTNRSSIHRLAAVLLSGGAITYYYDDIVEAAGLKEEEEDSEDDDDNSDTGFSLPWSNNDSDFGAWTTDPTLGGFDNDDDDEDDDDDGEDIDILIDDDDDNLIVDFADALKEGASVEFETDDSSRDPSSLKRSWWVNVWLSIWSLF